MRRRPRVATCRPTSAPTRASRSASRRTGEYAAPGLADPWHWAPGTPALFAVAHLLAPHADGDGSPQQIRTAFWAQAAVGAALILVAFLLAAGIGGPIAGLLAAGAIAVYPPFLTATGDLVSEPLGALTLALAMLALLGAWRNPTWGRVALGGAALGVALLVRADLLVIPFLVGAAWMLLARRRAGLRTAVAQGALIAALPLIVAAPWIAYASLSAGRVIPVASSGPSTLFVGTYLPGDGKLSGVRKVLEPYVRRHMSNLHNVSTANLKGEYVLRAYIRERHPELVPGPYRAIPERDLRHALSFEARRNLKTYAIGQPLAYARMEVGKVARMWGGYYRGGTRNPRGWLTAWHLALVGLALAGAALGLALGGRRRPELALLLVPGPREHRRQRGVRRAGAPQPARTSAARRLRSSRRRAGGAGAACPPRLARRRGRRPRRSDHGRAPRARPADRRDPPHAHTGVGATSRSAPRRRAGPARVPGSASPPHTAARGSRRRRARPRRPGSRGRRR